MDNIFDDLAEADNNYLPARASDVFGADAPPNPQPSPTRPSRSSKVRLIVNPGPDDFEDNIMPAAPRTTRQSSHIDIGPARTLRSRSGHTSGSPDSLQQSQGTRLTRSGRPVASYQESSEGEDEGPIAPGTRRAPKRSTRSTSARGLGDLIVSDEEEDEGLESDGAYGSRRSQRKAQPPPSRAKKSPRKRKRVVQDEDDDFDLSDDGTSVSSQSHGFEDANLTSPSPEPERPTRSSRAQASPDDKPRNYSFRPQKRPINYEIPPPLDNDTILASIDAYEKASRPARPRPGLGRGLSGATFLDPKTLPAPPPINDDSDSDDPNHPSNRPSTSAGNVHGGQGLIGAGGASSNDIATAAGGPANFGKVSKDSLLADTDPLGVNTNVSFDEVGGLDSHIAQLKEMVSLPLLYPEIFQQFKITPPRGVLFHGPPGTGKTLLARALAASTRSGGKEVAFFMRKGADILSKWVGEAERQLRLLFEEARNCQPSIIFFDEIDGLAPVRSSKQDQIHASIVSTLLALMDGMDGRGQVIVIGATNRPDAVDPALRRPGRFDREFYFPLPNLDGRKKILEILTRGWAGWQGPEGAPIIEVLAEATKGYGGADLRALATEATLNAIQRTYPQIYKSTERLLVDPSTIHVIPKDFMISVKKIVASSARSTSSASAPLPPQLAPLLNTALDLVKSALDRALPKSKKTSVLEEAEWEDGDPEGQSFQREQQLHAMETQRVYRPRLLVHGLPGMGQAFLGAAALHHLEGVHVQSLDLGTLFSDSTRSVETALVQLFVEAKRRKPSVIYVPSLISWTTSLSDAARSTMRELLDSVASTDPILLMGVVQGDLEDVHPDVRDWFGYNDDNLVEIQPPNSAQRAAFFGDIIADIQRPPNQFPDAFPRRKRILPELPIAPPPPPRVPTAAEVAAVAERDRQTITTLIARLGPMITEMKQRYRKATRTIQEAHTMVSLLEFQDDVVDQMDATNNAENVSKTTATAAPLAATPVDVEMTDGQAAAAVGPEPAAIVMESHDRVNGVQGETQHPSTNGSIEVPIIASAPPIITTTAPLISSPKPSKPPKPAKETYRVYDVDLESMSQRLYNQDTRYLTPYEVLEDLARVVHNTRIPPNKMENILKAHHMYTDFDAVIWDPQFKQECERMAVRERARRAEAKVKARKAQEKVNSEETLLPLPGGSTLNDATLTNGHGGSLKRTRDEAASPAGPGSTTSEGSQPKRPKIVVVDDESSGHVDSSSGEPTSTPSGATIAPADGAQPSLSPHHPPTSLLSRRSPSPIYPDFTFSPHRLGALQKFLDEDTASLTVEQLEELRAMCLNCVWKRRSDWDRTQMIDALTEDVKTYIVKRSAGGRTPVA